MPSSIIQWFPGHMAKTRRMMTECLPLVDLVIEILDARIPSSSMNPEIDKICKDKPRLILMSRATLADPNASARWKEYFAAAGRPALLCDFVTGAGMDQLLPTVRALLADKLARYEAKGMSGKALRAMVVGIPNVGKSSFINKCNGAKKAKVENRPGVTVDKQWVKTPYGLELLDMPGVLWPKFEDVRAGENLAITGAIKNDVLNLDEIAVLLCSRLRAFAPDLLCARYKLEREEIEALEDWQVFEAIGAKRGMLIRGGEVDYDRTSRMLLDEYRSGKIGRVTLELPPKEG